MLRSQDIKYKGLNGRGWIACIRAPLRPLLIRAMHHPSSPSQGSNQPIYSDSEFPDDREINHAHPSHQPHSIFPQIVQNNLPFVFTLSLVCLFTTAGSSLASSAAASHSASPSLLSYILHLDKHMAALIQSHGSAIYGILFAIVFAETGLVLTPFLPGDSLLFAAGAFAR